MKLDDDYVMSRLTPRLVDRLMPFQKEGVKFAVKKHGRCLIADEMGLGKTIQAISVAYYYRAEWPLLIIVPSSLRYCWIEELEKWLPGVHPHEINLIRGGNDASDISSAQITIVTYGLLSKQTSSIVREALTNQHFKVIICDESHYIRNTKTASSKTVVPLIKNASRRVLLSGTPALSKPVELFPQIDALKPGGFGTWWQFTARYCDARMEWVGRQKLRKVNGASNLEELQSRLSGSLMIRREKKDVLTELPPKQRQKVLFELKDSSQKKDILNMFEELKPMLRKGSSTASLNLEAATEVTDEKNKESLHRLSLISKLYQLSGEAKIGPVKEYLEMLCDNKSLKFLVFAYHHVMMNGIQQTLWERKVKFIRIDGETKPEDRLLYVQQFQSDPDTKVAILSILAAGVGLTFTAAKLVVFAEMYWTPGVMVQCEDRAHRIGQTANLPVHYLVAKGTMDEWVWGAVCRKTIVTSTALSGKGSKLEADEGDSYQVDLLSNADAWVPTEQTDMDFQTFFQSQKSNDQRSILEFFTPPSSRNKGRKLNECSGQKRQREEADITSNCKKQKINSREENSGRVLEEVIILDSDEEEDQFRDEKTRKRGKKGGKTNSGHGRPEELSSLESDFDSPDWDILSTPVHPEDTYESEMYHTTPTNSASVRNGFCRLQSSSRNKEKKVSLANTAKEDCPDVQDDLATEGPAQEHWSCTACTFLNHSFLLRCEMCDTPSKQRKHRPVSNKPSGARKQNVVKSISNERSMSGKINTAKDQVSNDSYCSSSERNHGNENNYSNCQDESELQSNPEIMEYEDGFPMSPVFGKKKTSFPNVHKDNGSEACIAVLGDESEELNVHEMSHSDSSVRMGCSKGDSIGDARQTENLDLEKQDDLVGTKSSTRRRKTFMFDDCDNTDSSKLDNSHHYSDSVQSVVVDPTGNDEVDGYTTDDDQLIPSVETPTSGKRKCFQFESDSEEESAKEHYGKLPGRKVNAVQEKETSLRYSKPVAVCSPCEAEPRMMSTPAGQDNRCASSSWELLPCDSPCFNLELESSGDRSLEKDNSLHASKSSFLNQSNFNSSVSTKSKNMAEVNNKSCLAGDISGQDLISEDEPLPVLVAPRRNESKSEETARKGKEIHNSSKIPTCAKPLFKKDPSCTTSQRAAQPSDPDTCDHSVTPHKQTNGEADGKHLATSKQTPGSGEKKRHTPGKKVSPNVPVSSQTSFPSFLYCVSLYTGRVYLIDQNGDPLNENFLPLDVEMGNLDQLPSVLHHHGNLKLVQKFVREWNSLTETKKRLIVKRGMVFSSPLVAYDEVRSGKVLSTQRHKTKDDVTSEAVKMAGTVKGSVRLISKRGRTGNQESHDQIQQTQDGRGVLQALTSEGVPLCLNCQHPYENTLLQKSTITDTNNAWNTRFCSSQCMDKYWIQTHSSYCREKVYEVEHGVCQMCNFDAHSFYKQIRDTPDLTKRAKLLSECKFSKLKSKQKETIVRKPVEGQFWHVDHIIPVWEGGGMCDIDNMRTLCVLCHQKVTAGQARKRAIVRRLQGAAAGADITAFFQKS